MITADMHVHTLYSHGECTVREAAEAAVRFGLKYLAISEHSTANMFYGLKRDAFCRLFREIDSMREEFLKQGLTILKGVELNLLGNGKVDIPEGPDFEVRVLGYHRGIMPKNAFAHRALFEAMGLGKNPRKNTEQLIRAIEENPIDIIAHPGEYISIDLKKLAYAAARTKTLLEINNRHVTLSADDLRLAADCGAEFIINSDAHKKTELCRYQKAIDAAREAGVLALVVNHRVTDGINTEEANGYI